MLAIPTHRDLGSPDPKYLETMIGATSSEVVNLLELSYEYISSQKKDIIERYGKKQYEGIVKRVIWFSKSQLSFEDFYRFPEIRNSFHAFFRGGIISEECYQSREFYKRFARENPDLNKELSEIFSENIYSSRIKYQAEFLYSAYCIMLSYPEVKNNADLFT